MHILYSCPMTPGSISHARVMGLRELDHKVSVLDHRPYFRSGNFLQKVQSHLLAGPIFNTYATALSALVEREKPDLVFLEGFYISPSVLRRLKEIDAFVVGYSSDYFGYRSYFYRHLKNSAHDYDAVVITNELNRPFLAQWGVRNVISTGFGYDPSEHFIVKPLAADVARFDCDVAFGGHHEPFYEDMLRALKDSGLKLRVSGNAWVKASFLDPEEKLGHITPDEYRSLICSARIGPAFLSKWNKNTSGMRTFEVAAMGTFLLAERTDEQLGYFREGVEAEFFSSADELVAKAKSFLRNEPLRRAIAGAGHRRCLDSGYSYKDRMKDLVNQIQQLMETS